MKDLLLLCHLVMLKSNKKIYKKIFVCTSLEKKKLCIFTEEIHLCDIVLIFCSVFFFYTLYTCNRNKGERDYIGVHVFCMDVCMSVIFIVKKKKRKKKKFFFYLCVLKRVTFKKELYVDVFLSIVRYPFSFLFQMT
jgi:Na+/melibiose symporter-like transporter